MKNPTPCHPHEEGDNYFLRIEISHPKEYAVSAADRARFESNMIQFVRTELETGITFAHVALDSNHEERGNRNREHARKAYDTAKHFLKKLQLEKLAAEYDLLAQLATLKDLLRQLGETFPEQ